MTGTGFGGAWQPVADVLAANGLVTALVLVGLVTWLAELVARHALRGRIQGSVVAILAGLGLARWGGGLTGGHRGAADIPWLAGLGILGGAMLRDLAIVATAFGVRPAELAGFVVGGLVALACGYRDPVAVTTIGRAGAVHRRRGQGARLTPAALARRRGGAGRITTR